MTSGPHPQAGEGRLSQVLRLRERAANPQLGCFPSFVEVDGPRHASCETVLPSNLVRPLVVCIVRRLTSSSGSRANTAGFEGVNSGRRGGAEHAPGRVA